MRSRSHWSRVPEAYPALCSGFGGKTLLALTGTANASYKEHIDPLYADVHYVDPFASDALAQIDALLQTREFAVVQLELIQGVGGVLDYTGRRGASSRRGPRTLGLLATG